MVRGVVLAGVVVSGRTMVPCGQGYCIKSGRTIVVLSPSGAGPPEEDEQYERGVVESNCVYGLQDNRLVPQDQAWAAVPSVALLGPAQVRPLLSGGPCSLGPPGGLGSLYNIRFGC